MLVLLGVLREGCHACSGLSLECSRCRPQGSGRNSTLNTFVFGIVESRERYYGEYSLKLFLLWFILEFRKGPSSLLPILLLEFPTSTRAIPKHLAIIITDFLPYCIYTSGLDSFVLMLF